MPGGFTNGGAGATAHIHHAIVAGEPGQPGHGPGGGTPAEHHGYCGEPMNGAAVLLAYAVLGWLRSGTGHRYPSFPQRARRGDRSAMTASIPSGQAPVQGPETRFPR